MFFLICALCIRSGLKDDGSTKLRVVYDLTSSGINEATAPAEKLHCETLDMFVQLIILTQTLIGVSRVFLAIPFQALVACPLFLVGFARPMEGGH